VQLPTNSARRERLDTAIRWVTIATTILVPLAVWPWAERGHRLPALLLFRAGAIILVWLAVLESMREESRVRAFLRGRLEARIAAGLFAWSAVTAIFASQHAIALQTVINIACGVVFFLAALYTLERGDVRTLLPIFIPALLNAIAYLLEEFEIWHPFPHGVTNVHMVNGAFLGNPNDVGTFLVAPTIVAAVLVAESRGWRRLLFALLALFLFASAAATKTLTAFIAAIVGLAVLAIMLTPRRAIAAITALVAITVAAAIWVPQAHERVQTAVALLKQREYGQVLTGRPTAYVAAWEMFRAHPILGVGPGNFGFEFLPYKLIGDVDYPALSEWPAEMGALPNFAEAHNDHLQMLAEMGLLGYAVVAAGFYLLARRARQTRSRGRGDVARLLAGSLGAALFVLMLAQFPFELAAPATLILYSIAACLAWRPDAEQST
jgi:hypothetical protein